MIDNSPGIFLCPPPADKVLPKDHRLDMHYGFVSLSRDGEGVWQYGDKQRGPLTLRWLDRKIKALPPEQQRGTFTLNIVEPLREATYQRLTKGNRSWWVLIATGQGFE